jgi:hypothetical protein
VPVDVNYMVNPKLGVGVQTGIHGPLDGFGDSFFVPVALAACTRSTRHHRGRVVHAAPRDRRHPRRRRRPGAADFRGLSVFASWHN